MISFTVRGVPVPQGSMAAFIPKGWTRPVITSSNKQLKKWRKTVSEAAAAAVGSDGFAGKKTALRVTAVFVLPQAKSNKLIDAVQKPDLDKLVRSLLDGMSKIVFYDDCQIVEIHASKEFGTEPRVDVFVEEYGAAPTLLKTESLVDEELPF